MEYTKPNIDFKISKFQRTRSYENIETAEQLKLSKIDGKEKIKDILFYLLKKTKHDNLAKKLRFW